MASVAMRFVHLAALAAILVVFGSASSTASAVMGIEEKSPHVIAVSAFGSPLLPGKMLMLSSDARRVLMSVSLVKILHVLAPQPKSWFSFDNPFFKEFGPYLWFVTALFVLILLARREVRQAAIPAPRPKSRPRRPRPL